MTSGAFFTNITWSGLPDPLGLHQFFAHILSKYVEEEQIRKTHQEPPKDDNEEHLQSLRDNEEHLQSLHDKWIVEYDDMLRLPPLWRKVNHRIPLVNETKQYRYHLPRCPEAIKNEILEKIKKYMDALWWKMANVRQAVPLLCVAKKNGKLQTVVDARKRNDNTVKDVTPLPDQDQICMDVARAKYRSKIDLLDTYEQVWIELEDVWETGFSTPFGTLVSMVMQQDKSALFRQGISTGVIITTTAN